MNINKNKKPYEVIVFNDEYGFNSRCRSDIDQASGFTREPNGVIKHYIPEKNQTRYGYVIATGDKRNMQLLSNTMLTLYAGLKAKKVKSNG